MIQLDRVSKSFRTRSGRHCVIDNVTTAFAPGQAVAMIGANGAGKSTLLRLIAGTSRPTSGRVRVRGAVSWPVGFAGGFHPELTGEQNVRFLARIYGADSDNLCDFARHFSEVGAAFRDPVRQYSSGMKARLAFAVSMGLPFDTYLVDEVTAVGDAAFKDKSRAMLQVRLRQAGAIVVSHSPNTLRALCQTAVILHRGKLVHYPDVDEALEVYSAVMQAV